MKHFICSRRTAEIAVGVPVAHPDHQVRVVVRDRSPYLASLRNLGAVEVKRIKLPTASRFTVAQVFPVSAAL